MKKFRFHMDVVVQGNNEEDALRKVGDYISVATVRVSNEQDLKEVGAHISLKEIDPKEELHDLRDKHPPIEHNPEQDEPVQERPQLAGA